MTLDIASLSPTGRGVSDVEGKPAFVDGALAAEQVSAAYVRRRRGVDELKTVSVLQASPQRVMPPCEFAGLCGGCSLQHMDVNAQIEFKLSLLLQQMQQAGNLELASLEILPKLQDLTQHYRRKARLAVRVVAKKGGALVGFREKYSSFITDMDDCKVLVKEVAELIQPLRALITALQGSKSVPQIEVAVGEVAVGEVAVSEVAVGEVAVGEVAVGEVHGQTSSAGNAQGQPYSHKVALVLRHLLPFIESDMNALLVFAQQHDIDLYLQPAGNASVHKIFPAGSQERLQYFLPEFDLQLNFHPMDFTQINAGINRKVISRTLSLLDLSKEETVLDLFCGIGNFTLATARQAKRVVGIEGSEEMVKRGVENAALNGIENVEFHAADLFKPIATKEWAEIKYDKILLDPPRSGAIEIIPEVAKLGAEKIVYISCNPATLARDSAELIKAGYQLQATGVMDMFPHTTQVESMAVFALRK